MSFLEKLNLHSQVTGAAERLSTSEGAGVCQFENCFNTVFKKLLFMLSVWLQ